MHGVQYMQFNPQMQAAYQQQYMPPQMMQQHQQHQQVCSSLLHVCSSVYLFCMFVPLSVHVVCILFVYSSVYLFCMYVRVSYLFCMKVRLFVCLHVCFCVCRLTLLIFNAVVIFYFPS